jgi:hypothetical protein
MMASNVAGAAAVAALLLSPLEAGELELIGGSSPAARIGDGMIQTVQHRRVGGAHVNRNVNVNVNRNVHVNGYRPRYHPGYPPGRSAAGRRSPCARRLGRPAGLVPLGARRRNRGRRGDRLRHRRDRRSLGRLPAAAGPLLVLHRPEPHPGLLGRLPLRTARRGLPSPFAFADALSRCALKGDCAIPSAEFGRRRPAAG